jgi:dCMP deaminase
MSSTVDTRTHFTKYHIHNTFLKIAENISEFSKCVSKRVGCVVVKDMMILTSGCNGTPCGTDNCCDLWDASQIENSEYREQHHKFAESIECHAEENAILNAVKHGINISDSVFYVSLKPCERCLKMIMGAGIKYIYYRNDYDKFIEYSPVVKKAIEDLHVYIIKWENLG